MKNQIELTPEDIQLLNHKLGIRAMLAQDEINIPKALRNARYLLDLKELQAELVKLQHWVINNKKKVVILFEGRDAAGKTGVIRRITEHINPRHFRVIALDKPTDDERHQWYFQRYVNHLPVPGEIVFFDRSWYNRAIVEPVNGFCTQEEYEVFMSQVNDFERMITQADTYLLKFYLSISKKEQAKRFDEIRNNPVKKWKITEIDIRARELWDDYTDYKLKMREVTDTDLAPWHIIDANEKNKARLSTIEAILDNIPYKEEE